MSGSNGRTPKKFDLTEVGNARRLVEANKHNLRYVAKLRRWIVWDSTRWKLDETGAVSELAKAVTDAMWLDVPSVPEGRERDTFVRHVQNSANKRALEAMVALAQTEPGIPVLPEDLNCDPNLLNTPSGTIDLTSGTLRPHNRDDLITMVTGASYDPAAKSDAWDRFIAAVFAGDEELIRFVQRFLGYSLTGLVRDHALLVCWGDGCNGKSTLIETFMSVLGPDYATKAAHDLLLERRGEAHPTERADLYGKRFVAAVETGRDRRLNESLVKELTGGDTAKGRFMHKDFFSFPQTWKICIATNNKPVIRGRDLGIWRRIHLLPFTETFEGIRQDRKLREKLLGELDGILAWAVRGCVEWQANGLGSAEAIADATREYRVEQDVVSGFFTDCCVRDTSGTVRAADLWRAYSAWATGRGAIPVTRIEFAREVENHGGKRAASNGVIYRGIVLRSRSVGTHGGTGTDF